MRKAMGRAGICLLIAVFFWVGTLISDRQRLRQELIRLHVVAASDEAWDQQCKLRVRDAVTQSLQSDLEKIRDPQQALAYLNRMLPRIEAVAREALEKAGCSYDVTATLCREAFDTRYYDTFTLPAGVYQALRIVIGEGEGQNWWCVVFPGLCIPAAAEGMEAAAAGAGFPEDLTQCLVSEPELRFGLLDALGHLENILFAP